MKNKKHIVTGILAHVDAGKTTLSEAILYTAGNLRKIGRVDNGDAFLDTYELERSRGITIFSKQAEVSMNEMDLTLLDTPGHVDFSAEMERTLQVLDYAVLVISGADGVQGHTLTLWSLLERYKIPTFLFINKMDQDGTQKDQLLKELQERLSSGCIDFGEKGFKGVKIETISFILNTKKKPNRTKIESYITNKIETKEQNYITAPQYPYWLIYRNIDFDKIAEKMQFNIFEAFRDRSITKAITKPQGKFRILKSRNIGDNKIIDIIGYDCYIDNIETLNVSKFLNKKDCILVPNLSYNPRACLLPQNCITDGSVAILTLKEKDISITKDDLSFYATAEFTKFYAIARNLGTRSLNIDNNSVFFFGKLK